MQNVELMNNSTIYNSTSKIQHLIEEEVHG